MQRRELIILLMESPFYFDTPLRERLAIVKYNEKRFPRHSLPENLLTGNSPQTNALNVISTDSPEVI